MLIVVSSVVWFGGLQLVFGVCCWVFVFRCLSFVIGGVGAAAVVGVVVVVVVVLLLLLLW